MNSTIIDNRSIYYFDRPDDQVVEMLQRNKLYGQVIYNLVDRYLRMPSTILDIGANFGTFGFIPANKGHRILAIESNLDEVDCLKKTYHDYLNVFIEKSISDLPKLDLLHCINFSRAEGLMEDINDCQNLLTDHKPILLMNIDVCKLKDIQAEPSTIFSLVETFGFHSFFYNAPNFLLSIDKKQPFPFCNMIVIALHTETIIEQLGKITFGTYLPSDITDKFIATNSKNAKPECAEYLDSIKTNWNIQ
jgi:hypothetical protein